jgi:hypothetical protein
VKDENPPYATPEAGPPAAPVDRGSLARGFLAGLGAIAAGWVVMAALQFLAFDVIGQDHALALVPALLSLPWIPIAVALLAVHYFDDGRVASGWGVLLAAAVSLALLVVWINLPVAIRLQVGAAVPLS